MKLPKNVYNELSSEGKALVVQGLKKQTATRNTAKVRRNMADDIAKKVISAMKRRKPVKRTTSKRRR